MSRPRKPNRRQRFSSTCDYASLEPRQLLATIHVDFGFEFNNELTVSDTQVASLNGPEIFDNEYSLESFTAGTIADNIDANGDEVVNAADAQSLAEEILRNLDRIFMPFEVQVQEAMAGSFAEIETILNADPNQNDVYIFVGGISPAGSIGGASVIDSGNTQDNLAFVFNDVFDTPGGLLDSSFVTGRVHARSIAKHAAHTFGLESVEGGDFGAGARDSGSHNDVMAAQGTNASGELYRSLVSLSSTAFFTDQSMSLMYESGTSSGSQNSLDAMIDAIGLRDDAPAYITGNSNLNEIRVERVSATAANVTIDGREINGVDVSDGLWIEAGGNADSVDFDHAIDFEVTLWDGWSVAIENGAMNAVVDGSGTGLLNGKIRFLNSTNLMGGDFDDQVVMQDGGLLGLLSTGGGDDVIDFLSGSQLYEIEMGAGDDTLKYFGGFLGDEILGGGDFDGGSGSDTIDYSMNESHGGNWHVNSLSEDGFFAINSCHPRDVFCVVSKRGGFESIIGSNFHPNSVDFSSNSSTAEIDWVIDGDTATVTSGEFNLTAELIGFDSFSGQASEIYDFEGMPVTLTPFYDSFVVLETVRPIKISNAAQVVIGSDTDLAQSHTDNINHQINISGDYDEVTRVFISNFASSTAMNAVLGEEDAWNVLSGATNSDVHFDGFVKYLLTVHGSDQFSDVMKVNYSYFYVNFVGNGGDDLFFLGSTAAENDGQLDYIRDFVRFDGGAGVDRLHLNDQGANLQLDYRLDQNWVRPSDREDSNFSFVRLGDSVDVVQLRGSEFDNVFDVTPAVDTRFILDGGSSEKISGDYLKVNTGSISSAVHSTPSATGGNWTFADRKPVIHDGFERLNNLEYLATSRLNAAAIVRVFNADHRGGVGEVNLPLGANSSVAVNTAVADMNFDGLPDLIVASRMGGEPAIKVYDMRNGNLISEFQPYGSNYQDGINVAVGNVMGDGKMEIITSKMDGAPLIRVFSRPDSRSDAYQLGSELRPFDSKFVGGSSLAIADMNFDGYDDVISGAGPGHLPLVNIYDVSVNDRDGGKEKLINRFQVLGRNYRGGINVEAGNWHGNPKPELFVTANETANASPWAGNVYSYRGERLPVNAPSYVLPHDEFLNAFSHDRAETDLAIRDLDKDGIVDWLFATNTTGENRIKAYSLTDDLKFEYSFSGSYFFQEGTGIS